MECSQNQNANILFLENQVPMTPAKMEPMANWTRD